MQLGALGRTTPILLVLGGIAAPLAFAELFVWTGPADGLALNRPAAESAVPDVGANFLPAGLADGCTAAGAGIVALGAAVTLDDAPYAIAEGQAPATARPSAELLHQGPVVLGPHLRVQSPTVAFDSGCGTDPAYRSEQPVDHAINT